MHSLERINLSKHNILQCNRELTQQHGPEFIFPNLMIMSNLVIVELCDN